MALKPKLLTVVLTAALTSLGTFYLAARYTDQLPYFPQKQKTNLPVNYVDYNDDNNTTVRGVAPVDFQAAAESSVKAVVHINTSTKGGVQVVQDPFAQMFGIESYQKRYIQPQMGSGSGVVISDDGYIVTNNHVVAGADEVTVTFNDRFTTTAKVVGTDPSTDIAVLKVAEKNVPFMEYGNSDDVHLGQWVLAVGYPLTLDATVTAGIVSAKSRALGINNRNSSTAIESFIQTDAAVNPGNSGGALVSTNGQLVGINSAIASPTGSYAGYSYAIPSNIVKKVVNDIRQYGKVQRGYMGVEFMDRRNLSREKLAELGIDRNEGVYIAGIRPNTGAAVSGLKVGDFITKINGQNIKTEPQLQEQVARYKPGDNLSITYMRAGKEMVTSVELKNISNNTGIVRKDAGEAALLGATFRVMNDDELKSLPMKGIVVSDVGTGSLKKYTNMRNNFVITSINEKEVKSVGDLQIAMNTASAIKIAGYYPGSRGIYYYGLNPEDIQNGVN